MAGYQYKGDQPASTPALVTKGETVIPRKAAAKSFADGPVPSLALQPKAPAAKLPWWEEPPARTGNGYVDVVLEQLKSNPGKWARVRDGIKNAGGGTTWTKRGCEATTRRMVDGTYSVWARWPEAKA